MTKRTSTEADLAWSLLGLFKRRRKVEIGYQLLGERTSKLSALCARHPELASDAIDIVFVGLESAGKSSLLQRYVKMEQLPVAKRKCTTVPFEINLHRDESVPETTATMEGKPFSKTDLERKNRAAIAATPVRIQVRGPNLPTITFIDTPGVFEASHRGEKREEVAVSKAIATSYAERPNSVVVLVADISIPLRLNSVWALLQPKVAAGRAMVAFTHADKASEVVLRERRSEVADTVGSPTCVLLCNKCQSPGEEELLLSDKRFAAMPRRGIVEFNRCLAGIIDAANRAVIPVLKERIAVCSAETSRATEDLGTPIDRTNLAFAQDYLREWLVPRLVPCLRWTPPQQPAREAFGDVPEFLQAAERRRRCARHRLDHYEKEGRRRDVAMMDALALLQEDASPMKLGRFPDLHLYLSQRLEEASRMVDWGERLRLAADCSLERANGVYADLILDLHRQIVELDFGAIPLDVLVRETPATMEERERLSQQHSRLRRAAEDLDALERE